MLHVSNNWFEYYVKLPTHLDPFLGQLLHRWRGGLRQNTKAKLAPTLFTCLSALRLSCDNCHAILAENLLALPPRLFTRTRLNVYVAGNLFTYTYPNGYPIPLSVI